MPRSLQHDRLMRASHLHVAATARDDSHEQQIVALRLIQHPGSYSEWEQQHSQLMQRICEPAGLRTQIVRMRAMTLALIHRRSVFEYLRDRKITGARRHRYIALFYGSRDYASSVVVEHGHYTRSWISASCSRFIGAEILHDPAFEAPLTAYEQWYREYFRVFCDLQLDDDEGDHLTCDQSLLPFLKERAQLARAELLRLR